MAGYRQIHTQIWKDEWFIDLRPNEKLLFIYLFSNDLASISGIYKLPVKVISNETELEIDFIEESLNKFEEAGKVLYRDGIIWIFSMSKYHSNSSERTQKKVLSDVENLPHSEIKIAYLAVLNGEEYHSDTISIPYQTKNAFALKAKAKAKAKTESKAKAKITTTAPLEEQDEFTECDNELSKLNDTFITETGIFPIPGDQDLWFKNYSEMVNAGVEPSDLQEAINALKVKNYTIVSPQSVKRAAMSQAGKRRAPPVKDAITPSEVY